jgi:DNA-binding SARP family transcriptional activator
VERARDGSGLAVSVLGPVAMWVVGMPVSVTAKQAAVLAMLALEAGQVVSVDRLIDGAWGENAPRTVQASL